MGWVWFRVRVIVGSGQRAQNLRKKYCKGKEKIRGHKFIFPVETSGGRAPQKPWVGLNSVGHIKYTPATSLQNSYLQQYYGLYLTGTLDKATHVFLFNVLRSPAYRRISREFFTTSAAHDVNFAALAELTLESVSRVAIRKSMASVYCVPALLPTHRNYITQVL